MERLTALEKDLIETSADTESLEGHEKKTGAKEKTFNIIFLNQDISKDRKVSHHRLKIEILNASTFEPLFIKNEIIQIGKAYGLTLSKSLKKSVMVENLAEKLEMQNMPYPEKLRKSPAAETSTDTPSTSTGGTTDTSSTSTGGTTDTPSTSTGGTTDTPSTSTGGTTDTPSTSTGGTRHSIHIYWWDHRHIITI